jgi:hypothetical protein
MAKSVPLCEHVFSNGKCCELPALRGSEYCYWHHSSARRARLRENIAGPISADANTGIDIPLLEDANAIQVSIQEVIHALLDRRIDSKRAALILYALQLALTNQKELHTEPFESQRQLVVVPDGEGIPKPQPRPRPQAQLPPAQLQPAPQLEAMSDSQPALVPKPPRRAS